MFLSPCAGRGWAPCSGGVSGSVTQRWVRVLGFPWLTHSPRPACASAQAGAIREGVAHSEGVPGTRGAGAEGPRAAGADLPTKSSASVAPLLPELVDGGWWGFPGSQFLLTNLFVGSVSLEDAR